MRRNTFLTNPEDEDEMDSRAALKELGEGLVAEVEDVQDRSLFVCLFIIFFVVNFVICAGVSAVEV